MWKERMYSVVVFWYSREDDVKGKEEWCSVGMWRIEEKMLYYVSRVCKGVFATVLIVEPGPFECY